jgi:hypothetical protein
LNWAGLGARSLCVEFRGRVGADRRLGTILEKIRSAPYIRHMGKIKAEYWLILALVFISALAFPAFMDVQRLESIVLSICSGIGLR